MLFVSQLPKDFFIKSVVSINWSWSMFLGYSVIFQYEAFNLFFQESDLSHVISAPQSRDQSLSVTWSVPLSHVIRASYSPWGSQRAGDNWACRQVYLCLSFRSSAVLKTSLFYVFAWCLSISLVVKTSPTLVTFDSLENCCSIVTQSKEKLWQLFS